ncbi:MAG: hypothetical protein Q8M24_18580 [Pseudolabrys sp.]|nr:hypothetical protein [Pseudolabrys sp.]MDP2297453.1 hypothetical protein [Pseudolabrys sp.]
MIEIPVSQRKDARIHIRAEALIGAALELAAARQFTSKSEYLRRALLNGLRADGIDPSAQTGRLVNSNGGMVVK